jgi:hypothetical protein
MQVRCKVCGKPLRDPISIARGAGPKCAGISTGRKSYHSTTKVIGESVSLSSGVGQTSTHLFSFVEERQSLIPETLRRYPSDLVQLVLSAPAAGSIGNQLKLHARRKHNGNGIHPAKVLKQIRRMCIEFRLLFWPGLFRQLEPIPCIPYGESDWKIGENGKVCTKDELVSYLSRYGMISPSL